MVNFLIYYGIKPIFCYCYQSMETYIISPIRNELVPITGSEVTNITFNIFSC